MTDQEAQDLLNELNDMAEDICPNLRLDFMSDRSWPYVQVSFIGVTNSFTFDNAELQCNSTPQLIKLFKRRAERSLIDMRKKLLEDLRQLRGK